MPSPTLVRAHRRDLEALVALALADLGKVWQDISDGDTARTALMDTLPALALLYGSAVASLAADWYDEFRDAEQVPGRFTAVTAELPDRGRTDALARWGISPLFATEPDFLSARTLVAGGFQRLVADADRSTILRSVTADPKGTGWERVTSGGCDFCQSLAGGPYATEKQFQSHDNCGCIAVPVYGS
jgi:hypothetical protein